MNKKLIYLGLMFWGSYFLIALIFNLVDSWEGLSYAYIAGILGLVYVAYFLLFKNIKFFCIVRIIQKTL
jgi:hypothetical protein